MEHLKEIEQEFNNFTSYNELSHIRLKHIDYDHPTSVLHENVVSVDELYALKGNAGWLTETWDYANEWQDTPTYHTFKTAGEAVEWYANEYRARACDTGREFLEDEGAPEQAAVDEFLSISPLF